MHPGPTAERLEEVLPGSWGIRASNLVHWLSGERGHPLVSFEVASTKPLVLIEELHFTTPDGRHHLVTSRATWTSAGFVVRGIGLRRFRSRRWSVDGISEDGTVLVVRHGIAHTASDGIDVLVRESMSLNEVRALVANDSHNFQLSLEDFASLSWLPVPGHR